MLYPQRMGSEPGSTPAEDTVEAAPGGSPATGSRSPSSHDQTVEAALAASSRAEATLDALYQAIQHATQGVSGAREANDQLAEELHRVREMHASSNEQRLVYRNQVALLQEQLEDARNDREFLVQEQDRFLAGLLEEHEQTLSRLAAERDEAFARIEKLLRETQDTAPPKSISLRRTNPGLGDVTPPVPQVVLTTRQDHDRNLEKLLSERDRSRDVLRRLQQQRDEAQQSLAQVTRERDQYLSELSRFAPGRVILQRTAPSPAANRRTQPAVPHLAARATDPSPPDPSDALGDSVGDRATAPPGNDLQAAIALSRPSPPTGIPAQIGPRPPLKRKPDAATQPLGGYSVRGDDREDGDGSSGRG
jgi:hypothetical protein